MTPPSVREVARIQLASGIFDAWIGAGLMWAVCGHLGGLLTAGWAGGLGGIAGWMACGLAPFGWLQILLALQARDSGEVAQVRRLARLQVAALALGGVTTACVGLWALRAVSPSGSASSR